MPHGTPPVDERAVSRRQLLLSGITVGSATAAYLAFGSRPAAALELDTLSVSGADATLADPPSEVRLDVGGTWEITGPTSLEQARVVLQVHDPAGNAWEPAEHVAFDTPASGSYELSANLLNHPDVVASDLIPAEAGATKTTEFKVRIVLLAVKDANPVAEAFTEDTAAVTITRDGLELTVSGSGSMTVIE